MTENTKVLNKSLSIRVTPNGLSFCTYTPQSSDPFVYKEFDVQPTISLAANLREALLHEPLLKDEFQRVNVLVTSPRCTFVPVADFNADAVEDIFHFNFPKEQGYKISYNVLRRSGLAIIFGLDKNVYQLIMDDFPRARFYASASTLIEFFGGRSMLGSERKMFCYNHEKEITLYAFSQGRMIWSNSFDTRSTDDSMYYILNSMQMMEFDPLEDKVLLVGDTGSEEQLKNRLQNFVRNVSLVDGREDFRMSITGGMSKIPYDMHTLLVCGF